MTKPKGPKRKFPGFSVDGTYTEEHNGITVCLQKISERLFQDELPRYELSYKKGRKWITYAEVRKNDQGEFILIYDGRPMPNADPEWGKHPDHHLSALWTYRFWWLENNPGFERLRALAKRSSKTKTPGM